MRALEGMLALLGEHTREVLAEIGYAEAEIGVLRKRGVVAWEVAT